MYCQVCGAYNADERDFCVRCHQKLMVVSGALQEGGDAYDESAEEGISFDEHLLERISILEEVVKRTAESVRQVLGALQKQERNLLITQTGIDTLRELLEQKGLTTPDEWGELWETKMDYQLLVLEERERFSAIKERVAALYHGERRQVFLQLLDEAESALSAYDIERAVEALEAAYKLDRENYDLAYFLGETYFNEGDQDKALSFFSRVLEVKPDHYEGLVYSGVLHQESGERDRAERYLARAVELYPEAFLPRFSLGAVYAGQGELQRAVECLRRAVELDPVPQAQYLLGNCLYEMGHLGQAIRSLQDAVDGDPNFEEARYLLGLAYLDRGWTRKAEEEFRQAQRLNPRKIQYEDLIRYLSGHASSPLPPVEGKAADWFAKGEEQRAQENLNQALAAYRAALAVEPDHPTVLMSYAMLCLKLNRSQEIELVTRKVLEQEPGEMLTATASTALVEALRSQGRFTEGNRIIQRLLEEGTSNFTKTIAYYEMAYNLAEAEEDLDQALDYAQRSLELSPEELRQFPLAALGWIHYKRREFDKAVDYLSQSSELGVSATTLTHLGMALLAAGREGQARRILAEARKLSDRGSALQEKMMQCMKDSGRLLERVRSRQKK